MIVPFVDASTGTVVYINPGYVVSLRPDAADPDPVSEVKLRDGESLRLRAAPEEAATKLRT